MTPRPSSQRPGTVNLHHRPLERIILSHLVALIRPCQTTTSRPSAPRGACILRRAPATTVTRYPARTETCLDSHTSAAVAQSSPCVASLGRQPHQMRAAAMIRPAREKWIFSNDTTVASAGQGGRHRPGATPRVATRWDQLICGGRGLGRSAVWKAVWKDLLGRRLA
jgi:hypothetical protein